MLTQHLLALIFAGWTPPVCKCTNQHCKKKNHLHLADLSVVMRCFTQKCRYNRRCTNPNCTYLHSHDDVKEIQLVKDKVLNLFSCPVCPDCPVSRPSRDECEKQMEALKQENERLIELSNQSYMENLEQDAKIYRLKKQMEALKQENERIIARSNQFYTENLEKDAKIYRLKKKLEEEKRITDAIQKKLEEEKMITHAMQKQLDEERKNIQNMQQQLNEKMSLPEEVKEADSPKNPSVCIRTTKEAMMAIANHVYDEMNNTLTARKWFVSDANFQYRQFAEVTYPNVLEVLNSLSLDSDEYGLGCLFGDSYGEYKRGSFNYQIFHNGNSYIQKNMETGMERQIHYCEKQTIQKATEVLYGKKSTISIEKLLKKFNHFKIDGEKITNIKNPIVDKLGKQMSEASGKFYKFVNSELWLKPSALQQWLSVARERNYTHVRLVKHCGNEKTYKGASKDPIGLHCEYAGSSTGQKYGPGLYFGLSDTVSSRFNDNSENPEGTGIMCLLLCREELCSSTVTSNKVHGGIKTFCWENLSSHDDAIVVLSSELILPLGLARTTQFD